MPSQQIRHNIITCDLLIGLLQLVCPNTVQGGLLCLAGLQSIQWSRALPVALPAFVLGL